MEQNLTSSPAGQPARAYAVGAMAAATRRGPRWLRVLMLVFLTITALATLAGLVGTLSGIGKLPACDAKRTRDTLSDLNKAQQLNASHYNFIRETGRTETEVACTANLGLRAGGTVEYDFRIFRGEGGVKVRITDLRRP
ncbi:MAG TPA: hypothetical protein VM434_19240 [Beijerinckiaceae bacterium]|nr:hypothetical protein [Beijerinckiaceae bacterium]